MKHFRILEIKGKDKHFTIEYMVNLFLGVHLWKNFNTKKYSKYEDALTDIKKIITPSDYENENIIYHYIDAYKIFKSKSKTKV